ncbi:MAG TPA: type II CAAX endopeptidase family protein [Chthoniobacterales bacterium]|jgi:membrane protease YdiL (CAAX protease family)|nr:type II CAAX endopeptidase family protein [Chthoniobacterales bacterium]
MIFSHSTGHGPPYSVPVAQALVLVVAAAIVSRSRRLSPLTRFLFTLAILRLGWSVIAPMLGEWGPIQTFAAGISWGPKIFLSRLLNVAGVLLILTTFIGRKFSRDDLFLRIGQLDAPAQPEPILWFRKPIPWSRFGPQLLVIFGLGLTAFLFDSLRPNLGELSRFRQLLPWALATAALNAANEEFQFRCVPLAHLRNVLPVREALWLTAIFFGLAHYFGQPSGPIGILMATIAGWVWAKSMVETRGAGWAFGIHMLQDVVIFYFLAMSMKT